MCFTIRTLSLLTSVLYRTFWVNYPNFIHRLIDSGFVDRTLSKYVISNPEWAKHPDIAIRLITRGKCGRRLFKYVLNQKAYREQRSIVSYCNDQRQKFVEQASLDYKEAKQLIYTDDDSYYTSIDLDSFIGKCDFEIGDIVETPRGRSLRVLTRNEDGHTAIVYKVSQIPDGPVMALKIIRWLDRSFLESVQKELRKDIFMRDINIPHAWVVEQGSDFCLKEWIFGIRGDEWYNNWVNSGCEMEDKGFSGIMKLYEYLSYEKLIYLKNLKALNLIWDAQNCVWVVIDVGPVYSYSSPVRALERFHKEFDDRWGLKNNMRAPPLAELYKRRYERAPK
eukprot:TRINITY_DN553_c0_g1_i3.p1 TRINITY_DN553_c0_g1~~TRINITY_DN553_c0_g1_i3.p1  ORF type:complete len:336 (+),score=32.50 TRINITY_DN553_c0_g1_i3:490-1497(+)